MTPIKYQVVGEEDYAFSVEIDSDRGYVVNSGTYTSQPPRKGRLTDAQHQELTRAIQALGIPTRHPMPPEGRELFRATLTIGEGDDSVTYPFWEGALEADLKLKRLIHLLEML